jgi:Trypsin-like peptidase domain
LKKFLVNLLLTFSLLASTACSQVSPVEPSPALSKDNRAAHHIHFTNMLDEDSCSSIAVGTHTLLTAAHCVFGTSKIYIDGQSATITSTLYDEQDHVLVVEDGVTFTDYAVIDQREPRPNEHVRLWAWPGSATKVVFREGIFSETDEDTFTVPLYIYVLPIYPGDSGGGVISDDGKVITVVSLGDQSARMACFALAFTPAQLAQVK